MTSLTRRSFLQTSAAVLASAGVAKQASLLQAQDLPHRLPRLRFGVNYVPRKGWWYCWLDWNQKAIIEDLEVIASLGMDHIRIQCLWSLMQPGSNYVSERMLEHMQALLDAADHAGLDVEVTVLNGWMSGLAFMPAWVQPTNPKSNMFMNPNVIEGEKLFFRKLAGAIGKHPRFLGFDLGNELGVLQATDNPVTQPEADAWANAIFDQCNAVAPGKFHVNGVDHRHWFGDVGFTRQNLATTGEATIVHSYSFFTGALSRFGYKGTGVSHLIEYQVELAYAYHTDLNRKVWVEETGASPEWTPESYLLDYADVIVRNAARTGKVWGITWWCSHDLDPAIKDFNKLEYTLGLIDQNNRPKPLGKKFAALADELRNSPASSTNRETALVIPDQGLAAHPPDWTYGDRYMKLLEQDKIPCIVLESQIHNEPYLRSRGIRELIHFSDVKL